MTSDTKPASVPESKPGEAKPEPHPVDQGAQEEAAEEREDARGYT